MAYTSHSSLDMTALDDIVNDYIYSRGVYASPALQTSKDFASAIYTHLNQYVPDMVAMYSTDMLLQAASARESVRLAQAIL